MQPGQEIDIPNRPVTRRRPVATQPASAAGAGASMPVDNGPTFGNGASVVGAKGGRKTGWILTIILLLLIAAGGVGFGVWAWMDGNTQKDQLNSQISTLQQQNNELQDELTNGNNGTINISTEGQSVDTADYIYVGEWGIKIKIPENIKVTSYEIRDLESENSAGTALCVTGATDGHDGATPSFVSGTPENKFTDVLEVCLQKNTRSTSEEDGGFLYETIPVGQFYIVGPQAIMGNGSDSDWEVESADALKLMLEDENNRSSI